jgi:hypothetical protein
MQHHVVSVSTPLARSFTSSASSPQVPSSSLASLWGINKIKYDALQLE